MCGFVGLDFDVDLTPQASHRRLFPTLPSDRKWYPLYEDPWRPRVPEADAAIIDDAPRSQRQQLDHCNSDRPCIGKDL